MNKDLEDQLFNLFNDPKQRAELLMPGYSNDLEKIIDQIVASAKTKINYAAMVQSFQDAGFSQANDFADYFVRSVVIEFGTSMDFESGLDNCELRIREINIPLKKDELKQITQHLLPALRKELGAAQKINYLSRDLTPIDEILKKISKEIEIQTDEFGSII